MLRLNKKGQNTAEYAVLIGLVVAATIAMQTYVKRSMQAGVKFAVDKAGKSEGTAQYEPYYMQSSYDVSTSGYKDTEKTETGGKVTRTYGAEEAGVKKEKTITRSGSQKIRSVTEAQ